MVQFFRKAFDVPLVRFPERVIDIRRCNSLEIVQIKYTVYVLFLLLFASFAGAQEVIKVTVTGDAVNIRSAPSIKGEIYRQAYKGESFVVESIPIKDKSDNSEWYKILFLINETEICSFYQAHKMDRYNFSYPYINTGLVREEPFTVYDIKHELDYLKRGRPADKQIGDDISPYIADIETYALKAPVTLYKEPSRGAGKIVLAVGATVLLGLDPEGRYCSHIDADDKPWVYVLNGKKKLIGWISTKVLGTITD